MRARVRWSGASLVPLLLLIASQQRALAQITVRRDSVSWGDTTPVHALLWIPVGLHGQLPTLIFSPGFGQAPAQYSALLESWAEAGYFVIAVAHPVFANPDSVELYDAAQVIAHQLVGAVGYILGSQARGPGPFAQVDPARVGLVGHSIGGAAAAQAAAWDRRVHAAMDLDGTLFGPVLHTGLPTPFFLLRQRFLLAPGDHPRFLEYHDQANLHEDSVFAHADTMYWLTVSRLDHMAFTDAALLPTARERALMALGLRLGAERAQEITTRYVRDFFGAHLSGRPRPSSLMQSPFSEAVLRHKP